MDYRPNWIDGTDEPAKAVLVSNTLSKMARRTNEITEEVTKIKQRVNRMILNFERSHGVLSDRHGPGMEIMENMDELENILHDQDQRRKYQQKLTVFIVGFQETCGQRRQLLAQLHEFFSIYSNINEVEDDQYREQPCLDLDGIAFQVTGAVRSAEAAMFRLAELHTVVMSHLSQVVSSGAQAKRKPSDDRGRKKMEKLLAQTREDMKQLTDRLLQTQEDLTLKDQQLKELQKQNEMRELEICHVKSQMEVTKNNLQILQEETAIQRSLLEAEITRQAGQLGMLENQKSLKEEQFTDSSTQWEVIDSMISYSAENTENNEEKNIMEINDEYDKRQFLGMEKIPTGTDIDLMDDMSKSGSQEFPSFSVGEENISATPLSPIADKNSWVHPVSNVEEYNSALHHVSAGMTPPAIQADTFHDGLQVNYSTPFLVEKDEHVRVLSMDNENNQSSITLPNSEEIKDGGGIPFLYHESDITAMYNEVDHVNYAPSSSHGTQNTKADNSENIHLIPPDEDTNPMTSNIDAHVNDFTKKCELDENTFRSLPVTNIMVAPSADNRCDTVYQSNHDTNDNLPDSSSIQLLTEFKTSSNKKPKAEININKMEESIHIGFIHHSSEPHTLNNALLLTGNKTEPTCNVGTREEATGETPSGDYHKELQRLSERLHICVRAIRNLLITAGFHSLVDELADGIQDKCEEQLSTNLSQLEKFPTVLKNLLQNITSDSAQHKELTDATVTSNEENTNKKESSLLATPTEDENHICDGPPVSTKSTKHQRELNEHSPHDFDSSSAIFTRTNEEHNRRELQKAICQGKVPIHIYQDTTKVMSKYRILCRERLHHLVWGYVQYISWNKAENLLRRQCLSRPQVTPVLNKMQKQKDQAFQQWRGKILKGQVQRLHLSTVLSQTLQEVHEDTGIFLIKPQISWPGNSVQETRKQSNTDKKIVQHPCFNHQCQDAISCHGISPTHVDKKWNYMHNHTELRPLVVTPKLLEMDIHRYVCRECCMISQLRNTLHGLSLNKPCPKGSTSHVKQTATFPVL